MTNFKEFLMRMANNKNIMELALGIPLIICTFFTLIFWSEMLWVVLLLFFLFSALFAALDYIKELDKEVLIKNNLVVILASNKGVVREMMAFWFWLFAFMLIDIPKATYIPVMIALLIGYIVLPNKVTKYFQSQLIK